MELNKIHSGDCRSVVEFPRGQECRIETSMIGIDNPRRSVLNLDVLQLTEL